MCCWLERGPLEASERILSCRTSTDIVTTEKRVPTQIIPNSARWSWELDCTIEWSRVPSQILLTIQMRRITGTETKN